jgi:hypothetical protein
MAISQKVQTEVGWFTCVPWFGQLGRGQSDQFSNLTRVQPSVARSPPAMTLGSIFKVQS